MVIFGNLNICVKNKVHDNDGRVLILDTTINGSHYLLIIFYNANTKREQLTTIKNLNNLLKDFEDFHDKKVIFVGDFNLIFDKNLESAGGSPLLKKHSLSEIIKLNENFNLCDIWRVRNPHKKLFTFRQKHFTGIIQWRLDYIFVSNSSQESVKKPPKFWMLYHPIIPHFSTLLLIMILLLVDQVFRNSISLYCPILSLLKDQKTILRL